MKTLRKRHLGRLQRFSEINTMIDLTVKSCEDRPTTSMVILQCAPLLKTNELYRYRVEVILHVYGTLAYKVTRSNIGFVYAYSSVFYRRLQDCASKQSTAFFSVYHL
jgi:hypothetical protein